MIRLAASALCVVSLLAAAPQALILWQSRLTPAEAHNQQSYRAVLALLGYAPRMITATRFRHAEGALLVVTGAAAARLTPAQQQEIARYLAVGGAVLADRPQGWLEALGFRWSGRTLSVSAVTDPAHPEPKLHWQGRDPVEAFTPPEGARVLLSDAETGRPLAVSGRHGAGRYVYLAAPLDSHTPFGTSHYPYLPRYLIDAFGVKPPERTVRLEAYFDPAFRPGVRPEDLAAQWHERGITAIYAAAWQEPYPFGRLIAACHQRGVRVYAWFAFPALTRRFWDEHPEWRERTATGADGRLGWRYPMNFFNPDCFRAAMTWAHAVLDAHPWDGVNLTELNYDADFLDYLRPDRFVPMNADVRQAFTRRAGFDPARLFDAASPYFHKRNRKALHRFLRFREEIVLGWHERVLAELEPLRRARGMEVVVTILDSLHGEYVRPALGVDARRIAALMRRFPFTLQVEDPAHEWAGPPDRYRRFARTYRKLVRDPRRLMFDINVVADRDIAGTALPSPTATGLELMLTVASAAAPSGRVALYSEHTVPAPDWVLLKTVAACPECPK